MIDTFLVPEKTLVDAKGDGPAVDVTRAVSRVSVLSLEISKIIEQESLEVSVYGSVDGATWSAKPMVSFPQKFYCEQSAMLLELKAHPDVKWVRAHWEVARWGRGTETATFELSVRVKEAPAETLGGVTAQATELA